METPFVWFDLRTKDRATSRSFYEQLFGWDVSEVPVGKAMATMVGGEKPWAKALGATALQAPAEGPAGTYTAIQEPGGAVFALFQPRA